MRKRAYKTYTKEFKVEAIRLADQSDQPMTQVARKLGLRVNQIYSWRKQLEEKQGDAFSNKQTATDKDAEIQRLNKALAASQEENEFLKKAAVSSSLQCNTIIQCISWRSITQSFTQPLIKSLGYFV
jgi:transposase